MSILGLVMKPAIIRPAVRADCPGILAIYNDAVLKTTASYDYEPRTLGQREAWFDDHQRDGFPVLVAEDFRGRGLGSALLEPLLESARERGLHAIIAAIDAENVASIRLHARFGFEQVGLFRQVGFKFGRWLDVLYMERLL